MRFRLSTFALAGALALLPLAAFAKDGENSAGTIKFDETSFEVSEDAGSVTIRVERSNGEDGAVSVHYSTSNGSAIAGQDYTAASGTLSWASGDESDRTFTVAIANDSAQEGGETFQIALSGATGGAAIDSARGTTTVVILANDGGSGGSGGTGGTGGNGGGDDDGDHDGDDDDDSNRAGTIKFDERDFVAVEESGKAVITVERSGGESGAVSVQYSTANGTATAGQDYTATSGTLTWAAGDESSKSFTVPILNDGAAEGTETVLFTLSNPTGGASLSAARGTSVLRIVDDGTGGFDDGNHGNDDNGGGNGSSNGKFEIRTIGLQGIEGQNAVVRVERSRGAVGAVSVRLSTSDLSAKAGEDYTATSVTLNWAAGDKADKTVQIPISDDAKAEGNETVRLTLSNPTGGATLDDEDDEATLTILDDDGQTTGCVADDDTGCLSGNRFKVEVHWRTQDGTSGIGHIDEITPDSAVVWFFNVNNKEMLVKVIDACELGNYWVFFAATTNVDFTVEVTDTVTGVVKEYKNPANNPAAPVQDTFTFSCNG